MQKETKEFLALIFIISFAIVPISFLIGIITGVNNECEYKSLGSRINIGYVVGCELARPRFNLNK